MSDLVSPSTPKQIVRIIQSGGHVLRRQGRWPSRDSMCWFFACALFFHTIIGVAQAAESTERDREIAAITQLKIELPLAAELLHKSETLVETGRVDEAVKLLAQATTLAPNSAIVARRNCEALTLLKDPPAAVAACRRALSNEPSQKDWPRDMLATVRALLAGKNGPTPEQLYQAITMTQSLAQKVPNQPWPYLAQCEIAKQLGQTSAIERCSERLQSVARGTGNAKGTWGAIMDRHTNWLILMAWLTLALAVTATTIHALYAGIKSRRRSAVRLMSLLFLLSGLTESRPVMAQATPLRSGLGSAAQSASDLGRVAINDKDPESSVPSPAQRDADPLNYAYFVMDVTSRAEKAFKHEDYKSAVRYFRALVKAVPNKSIGYAKLCTAYEALGDWPNAVLNCRTALGHDGVTDGDYAKYAQLLMEHRSKLSAADIQDVDAIVQQLRTETPKSNIADVVECEIGLKLHDKQRLHRCTADLAVSAPSDPKTLSFQWAYAVERGDYAGAQALLGQLRQTAISPKALQRMEEATSLAKPLWKRAIGSWWVLSGLFLSVLVAASILAGRRQQPQPAAAK